MGQFKVPMSINALKSEKNTVILIFLFCGILQQLYIYIYISSIYSTHSIYSMYSIYIHIVYKVYKVYPKVQETIIIIVVCGKPISKIVVL